MEEAQTIPVVFMRGKRRRALKGPLVLMPVLFLFTVLIGVPIARAQDPTTSEEFWPEIDVYINIKPKVRLFLLATVSKSIEDGELRHAQSYEAQVGVHVDYIPNEHVILRTGYRYGSAVGSNDDGFREHRLLTEQTLRKFLPGDFLLSDRNREDFRFLSGDFSFRYRNRVTIERELHLFDVPILNGRTITPYGSVEVSMTRGTAFGIGIVGLSACSNR